MLKDTRNKIEKNEDNYNMTTFYIKHKIADGTTIII